MNQNSFCPGHEHGQHIYDMLDTCYECGVTKSEQDAADVWRRVTNSSEVMIKDGQKGLFIVEEGLIEIGKALGV